jgi:hypothetical protein
MIARMMIPEKIAISFVIAGRAGWMGLSSQEFLFSLFIIPYASYGVPHMSLYFLLK